MSVSGEKLNLLIMRDSGETKRYRVRRSYFHTVISIFLTFPIVTALALGGCYFFWKENITLKQSLITAEQTSQENAVKAQRLSNLEALLEREEATETKLTQNASPTVKKEAVTADSENNTKTVAEANVSDSTNEAVAKDATKEEEKEEESLEEVPIDDGPGHVEIPVVDEGIIAIENVQSRLVEPRRIRTSLDLRNPGNDSLSGSVFCILSLPSGETIPLQLNPANVGNYKILRWKKAVLFANVPEGHDLFNAQMIIEVKEHGGKLLYRNIFSIEQ